jgi:hypothetical protein
MVEHGMRWYSSVRCCRIVEVSKGCVELFVFFNVRQSYMRFFIKHIAALNLRCGSDHRFQPVWKLSVKRRDVRTSTR